ncbi:MAG: hypothetical protein WDA60_11625 [Acidimicrobiia bacterium]
MTVAAPISVGVVGGGAPASVDAVGTITPADAAWTCEWWIGGDDRWHVPANEVAVRQHRVKDVAVVETVMRVPGGDAVQRVYAVAETGHPLVIEVENQSPAPFVLAFALRGPGSVIADGTRVMIDKVFVLSTLRAPSRWARSVGSPVLIPVTTGRALTGRFPGARDRSARLEVAFLHPVAHRTTFRAVLTRGKEVPRFDVRALPDAAGVARGWSRVLERGMQVQLPDRPLEARIRAARTEVLLRGQSRNPGPVVAAALEDWGFDAEAETAWRHLGARERRRAATRPEPASWDDAAAIADDAEFLLAVRRLLVHDARDVSSPVALCAEFPTAWRGQPVEVRDAPVAGGVLSYAVRWHGARPALLWDAPAGTAVRIPGLDPDWTSGPASGEALLGATGEGS